MKKSNTYKAFFSLAFLFAIALVFSSSCRRNKDCDVVINVVNGSTNAPVIGAKVHMYPPPGGSLSIQDQTETTDAGGTATFSFKLPAILQADVTPPAPLGFATALIKLEEGKQVSKTIKVY